MRKNLTEREKKLELIKAVLDGDIAKAQQLTAESKPVGVLLTYEDKEYVSFNKQQYSFDEWLAVYPSMSAKYSFLHVNIVATREGAGKFRWSSDPATFYQYNADLKKYMPV